MKPYEQYGDVKVKILNFPMEPMTDISQILPQDTTFADDIKAAWDNPDDFVDVGGHITILPFNRVLRAGKEHLAGLLFKKRFKKMKRRQEALDRIWACLEEAKSEQSSFFP